MCISVPFSFLHFLIKLLLFTCNIPTFKGEKHFMCKTAKVSVDLSLLLDDEDDDGGDRIHDNYVDEVEVTCIIYCHDLCSFISKE